MRRVAAFAFVGFVLFVGADIPQTAELAVAFAYLILLSAAMTVGPAAFGRISALFVTTAGGTSGGGTF